MSGMQERLATPIPPRLRTRPRDKRGYPIPWIVFTDPRGGVHFTINDDKRLQDCRRKKLCGLCGKRFDDGMWFIGGPSCFTLPNGAFIDPPNHRDCAEYALRVCPYLAAPHYRKLHDITDFPLENAFQINHPNPANRPDLFGLGQTFEATFRMTEQGGLYVIERWRYVEFWRLSERVNAPARSQLLNGID